MHTKYFSWNFDRHHTTKQRQDLIMQSFIILNHVTASTLWLLGKFYSLGSSNKPLILYLFLLPAWKLNQRQSKFSIFCLFSVFFWVDTFPKYAMPTDTRKNLIWSHLMHKFKFDVYIRTRSPFWTKTESMNYIKDNETKYTLIISYPTN